MISQSLTLFRTGWRPLAGWVCSLALAVHFIVSPFLTWIALLCGYQIPFPPLDSATLMSLTSALLGLGTLRTVEKNKETKDVG